MITDYGQVEVGSIVKATGEKITRIDQSGRYSCWVWFESWHGNIKHVDARLKRIFTKVEVE